MFFICQLAMPDFPGQVKKCVCSACKKEVEHRVSLSLDSRPKGWAVIRVQDDGEIEYLICDKCARSLLHKRKLTFVSHNRKMTVAKVREAIAWLTERGFAGHFYNVPPEVLADAEEVDVSYSPYGFYFGTKGSFADVTLFAPVSLDELTPGLRRKIERKLGMTPEEVIKQAQQKSREEEKLRGPLSQEEAEAAFLVSGHGLPEEQTYMWPQVSPYSLGGLRAEEFRDNIIIRFATRLWMRSPAIAIVAKPQAIKNLVSKLAAALRENKRERKRRECEKELSDLDHREEDKSEERRKTAASQ